MARNPRAPYPARQRARACGACAGDGELIRPRLKVRPPLKTVAAGIADATRENWRAHCIAILEAEGTLSPEHTLLFV